MTTDKDTRIAELEAQLAAKETENEHLHNDYGDLDARLHLVTLDRDRCAAKAEALSRILSALEPPARDTSPVVSHETGNVEDKPAASEGRQPAAWMANCCGCGRIVDTREIKDGGDNFGCQLGDGRWTCSPACWEAVVDPDARPSLQAVSMKWLADWQGRHDIVMPIAAYNELQSAITRPAVEAGG